MALFGPNIINGTDPAAAYGMGGAAAPAAPASPFGNGGFSSMLSSLSGALPDINNGLQSLAYGIGSFAKNPQTRQMYIQAALAHQQHMSADKREQAKALQDHGDEILKFIAQSGGNPQVMAILQPVVDHHIQATTALLGQDAGSQFGQLAKAYAAMPPSAKDDFTLGEGQVRYDGQGKPIAKGPDKTTAAPSAVQEYEYAVKQGFKGTLEQFLLAQKQAGASSVKINMPNQDEYNSRLYSARMQQANGDLEAVLSSGWKPGMVEGAVAGLPGGNMLASENRQLFNQARDNFINATLRRESGAAISADEYVKADKQYFPQPNDGAKVLAQKARNRALAITGIAQAGGRAPQLAIPAGGAPAAAPPAAATNQPAGGAKMPPPPPGAVLLGQ